MARLTKEQKREKQLEKNKKKLIRAITNAGLSWASFSSIIEVSDELDGEPFPEEAHAVWAYNKITKREQIILPNRTIENFNTKQIELFIKHEMLHKSMYRNLRGATNPALINMALDAAINKILYLSHRKPMMDLCAKAFNGCRTSIFALCDCSITREERNQLQKSVRKLFDSLYASNDARDKFHIASDFIGNNPTSENRSVPDPMNLYVTLSNSLNKTQKQEVEQSYIEQIGGNGDPSEDEEDDDEKKGDGNKEENDSDENKDGDDKEEGNGDKSNNGTDKEKESDGNGSGGKEGEDGKKLLIRGGGQHRHSSSKEDEKAEKEVAKQIKNSSFANNYSNVGDGIGGILDKYVISPTACNTEEIKDFVSTWQTLKQVEGTEQCIYSEIQSAIQFEPYPQHLSRTGVELVSLGVSDPDEMPLYMNISGSNTCKKKIRAYIDTSPSMREALGHVMHVLDFFDSLEECEYANDEFNGKYFFSQKVEGVTEEDWEAFKNGSYYGGWGTSFEAVIRHAIDTANINESDIIFIMTDGESSVTKTLIEEFNATGMKAYVMYFIDRTYRPYSYRKNKDYSSLDNLTGESFKIYYNEGKRR